MIARQQEKQPGSSTVAVAERMDAEEIQVQCRERDQGVNGSLRLHLLPALDQLGHERRRIDRSNGAETNLAPAARMHFDDVVFGLLVLTGIAHAAARQSMQL